MRGQMRVVVDRPVDEVFDFLADLRNEGAQLTVLFFSGVIPAGQPPTIQASAPTATCGG